MPHDTMSSEFSLDGTDEILSPVPETKGGGIRAAFRAASDAILKPVKLAGGKAILSAAMAVGAALGAVQAAEASIVTVISTGTVVNGEDITGVFGYPPGTLLNNVPYTLTYSIDDTVGVLTLQYCCTPTQPDYSDLLNTTVPTKAVLQIGTGSWTFGYYPAVSTSSEAQKSTPGDIARKNSYLFNVSDNYGASAGYDSAMIVVEPAPGTAPFLDYNWESSYSRTGGLSQDSSSFFISRTVGGVTQSASGYFVPTSSITINGPEGLNPVAKTLGAASNIPCTCDPQTGTSINERGDPITISNGNMFEQVTDYSTVGQNPLSFTRYYNSLGNSIGITTYASSLGMNWRGTYDRYLQLSANTINAERADGQILTFTSNGSGGWTSDTDVDVTLTQSGTTYTLTDHNDNVETYNTATMMFGGTAINYGQLASIQARNTYTQTLHYTSNVLNSVSDSYGRSLGFTYYTSGLLETVTTPDTLVLTYNQTPVSGGDQLTSVSYNTSPVTSQTYLYEDGSFPFALTGITDENSNRYATWSYDPNGLALTSQHGTGTSTANLTTMNYDGSTGPSVTNAFGVTDTYTLTNAQNVLKVASINRASTSTTASATRTFGYDPNGYLNSETDWNGNTTTYINNTHGQPTTINYAVGTPQAYTVQIQYDPTFVHLPQIITTPGLTSTFVRDANGNVKTRTDKDTTTNTIPYSTSGQTHVWKYTWNATGEELTVLEPRTDLTAKTTFTYNADGTMTQIKDALGHLTKITAHTTGGLPKTIVDENSVTTKLTYDGRLNLNTSTMTTTAGNLKTTWTHDPANELTAVQLPDNSQLTFGYDNAHRLTGVTDLFNNSITYTLDALGDRTLINVKNPSGTVTQTHSAVFDALGRITSDIGGMSQTTIIAYDNMSNVQTITPPTPTSYSQQTFDHLNRLATRFDSGTGGTTTIGYDAHNRMLSVQDANSNTTSYVYDGFGNRIQTASPDSGTSVFYYDPDSNMTQKLLPGPLTMNATFDALDRNLTAAWTGDTTLNVSKTYDQTGHGFGVGRLTSATDQVGTLSLTYDERGNITNESRVVTGAGTLSIATAFDAASNVSSITYPSTTLVTYGRDSMGRVTSVTAKPPGASSASNVATGITYEPFGPVTGLAFGNGLTGTYGYDPDYRPTTRVDAGTSVNIQNLSYGYYANDSVNTITDTLNAANSQTMHYDGGDRLTSAVSGTGGYGTFGWTYWDALGNVQHQTINGTVTTLNRASGSNQLTSIVTGSTTDTVASTPTGNINTLTIGGTTQETLSYNKANQLASAQTTSTFASYAYDLTGQRLEKSLPGSNPILYQFSRTDGELLAENDLHAGQTADYLYLNGRPIGEVNPTNGKLYFTSTDRLGTPQTLTDSTKAVAWSATYQPFGNTVSFTGTLATQSLRLPGQQFDPETGYNHNGFRDYAGTLTRYVQTDPIGLGGGMNTYQYANGNPFKWVDPTGEVTKEEIDKGLRVLCLVAKICVSPPLQPESYMPPHFPSQQTQVQQCPKPELEDPGNVPAPKPRPDIPQNVPDSAPAGDGLPSILLPFLRAIPPSLIPPMIDPCIVAPDMCSGGGAQQTKVFDIVPDTKGDNRIAKNNNRTFVLTNKKTELIPS